MKNQNSPERITIEDKSFGGHVEHWNLLTDNPATDVPKWLGLALNTPIMPMGLCNEEAEMDTQSWLIQGPSKAAILLNQVIDVENNKPKALKTAFPTFESPYKIDAKIERIIAGKSNTQAVLQLNVGAGVAYAFDSLYSVNHLKYDKDKTYSVQFNGWAYELEAVSDHEQIIVDDPASIKHHRALNEILANNDGVAPENLQELLDEWEPKSDDDKEPVTVNFSKMVAYLYGETLGQEDEAWFQSKIVGKTSMQFMDNEYTLYDVTLFLEEDQPAILARIATKNPDHRDFNTGQYIRGNIWLQASIFNKKQ